MIFLERELLKLINILDLERDLYSEMEELSLLKRKIIEKSDIKALDNVVNVEKALVEQLNVLDTKIKDILQSLSLHLNLKNDQPTIMNIIDNIDLADIKPKLKILVYDINSIIKRQKKINKTNQSMLFVKIKNVRCAMNAIMLEDDRLTYDSKGNDRPGRRQKVNIFDERV